MSPIGVFQRFYQVPRLYYVVYLFGLYHLGLAFGTVHTDPIFDIHPRPRPAEVNTPAMGHKWYLSSKDL